MEAHSEDVDALEELVSDAVCSDDEQRQTKQTEQDAEGTATYRQWRSIAVACTTHRGHLRHSVNASEIGLSNERTRFRVQVRGPT